MNEQQKRQVNAPREMNGQAPMKSAILMRSLPFYPITVFASPQPTPSKHKTFNQSNSKRVANQQ